MILHPSILVIEDDPLYRTLYKGRIGQIVPYALLRIASDGEEALAALADGRPELLILDLHVPGIDGKRLLELIRSDHANDGMVVLVISAFDEDLSEIGRHAYPDVFAFDKPMRADEFELALRQCMDQLNALRYSPAQPADSPVDHSHMRLYIGDDLRLHRAFATQFLDNTKGWTDALRQHLEAGDHVALGECARNIWAAAATIGAHDAAKLAHRLEFANRDRNRDLTQRLAAELNGALDCYCAALAGALI